MVIFSNGIPLSQYPITQDESGPSHINLKYASGVKQLPLDFGNQKVDYAITLDVACTVTLSTSTQGNYCVVQTGEYKLMFVHVYQHARLGTVVPAGGVICRIAPTSLNGGYAVHLHCSARKNDGEYAIRNLIFDSGIHVGVRVEFLSDTNIRGGNGTTYPDIGDAAKGAVAEIIDGPRSGNGYTWFDCKFLSQTGWCISNHMKVTNKVITFPDGTIPVIDPCQIKLEAQKADYEKQLAVKDAECQAIRRKAQAEVPVLEGVVSRLRSL